MPNKALKGKTELEVVAIEQAAEESRQVIEKASLELENSKKVAKAHVENILGVCNDYAKGIINAMPAVMIEVVLSLDEEGLNSLFGQKAINTTFCNVRKIADKETRKEARTIDVKAREVSQKAYRAAKTELFTAFDSLLDKIKPSANKALGLMVEGIQAWPEDVDNKSMAFLSETVRQGDYVLTFSASTKFKPEKRA